MSFSIIPDNVSKFDNVYDVLKERGFIEQTTDDEGIRELLGKEKIKFYIGVKGSSTEDAAEKVASYEAIIKKMTEE